MSGNTENRSKVHEQGNPTVIDMGDTREKRYTKKKKKHIHIPVNHFIRSRVIKGIIKTKSLVF